LRYINLILIVSCVSLIIPPVVASNVGAYNVEVTHSYVKSTAICSCGENEYSSGNNNYIYHTIAFENYCPRCNSYGSLKFNPKGVPEGEWTCTNCGSDYCAADGIEKISGSPYCLIKYNPPEVKAQQVTNVDVSVITKLDKFKNKNFLDSS
jgi:hypothetical protein